MFKLSLEQRQRFARNKRNRYWRNPQVRLARINDERAKRGSPPIASLEEVGTRSVPASMRSRDAIGRFVREVR